MQPNLVIFTVICNPVYFSGVRKIWHIRQKIKNLTNMKYDPITAEIL